MTRPLLVLPVVLVLAAPAAADPVAEEVRARVRAAVGYDAFRKLDHGVVLTGPGEAHGVTGTVTHRLHADGRYAELSDSRVDSSNGFDGKTRWTRMFLNPAFPAELTEGDRLWLHHQLLNHRWVAPDGGFAVTLDPGEHRAYRPCLVVRHPGVVTAAARVYVDPATWLPSRFSVVAGGQEVVVEVSDWKDVVGAKLAGRIGLGRHVGGPEFVATTAAVAPAPAGADPFGPPPPPADTAFDPAANPAVEAKSAKGLMFLRPTVNGRQGPWMHLAAKSPVSGLTPAAADRLGLPAFGKTKGVGPQGDVVMRYRSADRFAVGTAAVAGLTFLELPQAMEEIGKQTGVEYGGVVGADVLSRVVLEADFTTGRAAVHDPRTYRPPAGLAWEPLRFDRESAYLTGTFETAATGLFGFGTENSDGTLTFAPGAVRGLNLLAGRQTEPFGAGAELFGFQAANCEFRAFGRAFRPRQTQFLTAGIQTDKYPYSLGALTPSTLGPGVVVFDYANRRLGFVAAP